jgi:hypothetical protein
VYRTDKCAVSRSASTESRADIYRIIFDTGPPGQIIDAVYPHSQPGAKSEQPFAKRGFVDHTQYGREKGVRYLFDGGTDR